MADEQGDRAAILTVYAELSNNYRAIDELRLKLLALLPLATGTGILVFLGRNGATPGADASAYVAVPVGLFGMVATVSLYFYELHGVEKCAHFHRPRRPDRTAARHPWLVPQPPTPHLRCRERAAAEDDYLPDEPGDLAVRRAVHSASALVRRRRARGRRRRRRGRHLGRLGRHRAGHGTNPGRPPRPAGATRRRAVRCRVASTAGYCNGRICL